MSKKTIRAQVEDYLNSLSLTSVDIELIKKKPTRLYHIRSYQGEYILRAGKLKPFYKKWTGSTGFVVQLAAYKAFSRQNLQHFKVPQLIHHKGWHFMLIEFLQQAKSYYPDKSTEQNALIRAVAELQILPLKLKIPVHHKFISGIISWRKNIRSRAAFNLCRLYTKLGRKNFTKGLQILKKMPRLKKPVWVHRDLNVPNVLFDQDGPVTLIDFEQLRKQHFGIMTDGVEYSLDPAEVTFDKVFLGRFFQKITEYNRDICADLYADLRGVLLWRMLNISRSSSAKEETRTRALSFIKDHLLDDQKYRKWLEELENSD